MRPGSCCNGTGSTNGSEIPSGVLAIPEAIRRAMMKFVLPNWHPFTNFR